MGDLPEALAKKLPLYPLVPVTLLGRLALDKNYQGQRLGQFLLLDALYRSLMAAEQVASVAVIVYAISDEAREFYEHYGFIVFPNHTHSNCPESETMSHSNNRLRNHGIIGIGCYVSDERLVYFQRINRKTF